METGEKFLYTVELTESENYFLCGWEDRGSHINFNIDLDEKPEKELPMILYLFSHFREDTANKIE